LSSTGGFAQGRSRSAFSKSKSYTEEWSERS
jgi:hypothetical protein